MQLFSWDYDDTSHPGRWFRLANAYLDSSVHVFKSITENLLNRDYYHAAVGGFLFDHSLELFLKAAILQARGTPQGHHELNVHYRQFQNLYPGRQFEFKGAILDATKSDPARPNSEFHRYPGSTPGTSWNANTHFDTEIWIRELELFRKDYARIEPLCKKRHPDSCDDDGAK